MSHSRRSSKPLALLALVAIVTGCGSASPTAPLSTSTVDVGTSPTGSSASPTIQPSASPTAPAKIPVVPVADYKTTLTTVDMATVKAVLAGTSKQFDDLELVDADAAGILAALGLDRSTAGTHLRLTLTAETMATDLDGDGSPYLGIMRASQVGPSIRALGWGGKTLFGENRVGSLADWPLKATLSQGASSAVFSLAQEWTVAAAGDIMLDRGVYNEVVNKKKGVDFPFDGGTVKITSRYCCSSFGWIMPRTARVNDTHDVRTLMSSADLAMANMEGPAPDKSRYHSGGKLFTFDQDLLVGLKNAGIDIVSLANNHIGNAGRNGVRETVAALDKVGIAHMGAGGNDVAAHAPVMRTIAGVKVAVFGYDAVAASYAAGPGLAGTAYLDTSMASDVAAARKAGAQVVIAYPHWGTEYTVGPNNAQVRWAHRMIDAGVDVVIGNHPHWAQAMEVYKGKPIWYGLGNFVFDQTWSEQTEEGLILELTFNGSTLVQAWMHPIIDLSAAQPNLLDTASAQHVLDQVYKASKKYLPW